MKYTLPYHAASDCVHSLQSYFPLFYGSSNSSLCTSSYTTLLHLLSFEVSDLANFLQESTFLWEQRGSYSEFRVVS